MIAFITLDQTDRRHIQPADPIAREFIAPFCENPYQWIEKSNNNDWATNTKHPLAPYQLWEKHQDHNYFVGVRHGNETTYAALDIDKNSPYHPDLDETAVTRIKAALESLGLVRFLLSRSSNSGGLHIYMPLPEKVNSFKLACAIATALLTNGFKIEKGKLEIFPNVKAFDAQYNGLRLPLQQGGAIVDDDGNYISTDISAWVSMWKTAADGQDIQLLKRSLKNAKKPREIGNASNIKGDAAKYRADLIAMIENGWEPDSTQNLVRAIAHLHYIFDGITDLHDLTSAIAATARTTKGFYEYSKHIHEIEKVARNWAKWIIENPKYSPYGSKAIADPTPKEPKVSRLEVVRQGLADLVAQLTDLTFSTVRELTDHLCKALKTSKETLYKFQELWQPLLNGCNAASSNEYSDFNNTHNETCENTQDSESLAESRVTVTTPNELFGLSDACFPHSQFKQQDRGLENFGFDFPNFFSFDGGANQDKDCTEELEILPVKEYKADKSAIAISRNIAANIEPDKFGIEPKFNKPKEPKRENPYTLEKVQAICDRDPNQAEAIAGLLRAKLNIKGLSESEKQETLKALSYLNDFSFW